ncbi:MAG TPA: histidine phosphatase family protein [Bryobacteraceae bacterium]|jgi:alpha-ribazole phosphatase/probable phosphoglycerate mutase|nr:histidine phosphatase family protein [Bryobacteraceae bacterium]
MTRVWLIRHGDPADEARNRCYGSLDLGLSEVGRKQMEDIADYLKSEPISAVYASPRSRALEGARILASTVSGGIPTVAEDLREIDFGDFEGLTYDEIAVQHPDLYRVWMENPTEVLFPNGESFSGMRERVLMAFDAIRHRHHGETIALISHGGVNRILLAHALQMPDCCIFRLAQDYAAINLIEFMQGFPVVRLLNLVVPPMKHKTMGKGAQTMPV